MKDEQEKLCDVVKDDIIHGSFATTGSRGKKKNNYINQVFSLDGSDTIASQKLKLNLLTSWWLWSR